MWISSHDLSYPKNNLCGSIKDDVDFAEIQQMFLFCFIYECILVRVKIKLRVTI